MNEDLLQRIRHRLAIKELLGTDTPVLVAPYELDTNRRSQTKAAREAVEAGYLESFTVNGNYVVTNKALRDLEEINVNLLDLWHRQRSRWNHNKDIPYVCVSSHFAADITTAELMSVVRNSREPDNTIEFYRATSGLVFRGSVYAPEKMQGPVFREKLKEDVPNFPEILVSTPELRAQVRKILLEEEIESACQRSLRWGLQALGLLSKEEAAIFDVDGSFDFGQHSTFGMSNSRGVVSEWENVLAKATTEALKEVTEIHKKLAIVAKLQAGIAAMGGWDEFRDQYRARIRKTITEEKSNT